MREALTRTLGKFKGLSHDLDRLCPCGTIRRGWGTGEPGSYGLVQARGDGRGGSRYRSTVTASRPLHHLARQFTAFFGVGLVAAVVHYGLLIGLVEGASLHPVPATLAGYVAGGLVSYVLNRRHTYGSARPHRDWRFSRCREA